MKLPSSLPPADPSSLCWWWWCLRPRMWWTTEWRQRTLGWYIAGRAARRHLPHGVHVGYTAFSLVKIKEMGVDGLLEAANLPLVPLMSTRLFLPLLLEVCLQFCMSRPILLQLSLQVLLSSLLSSMITCSLMSTGSLAVDSISKKCRVVVVE